MAAIVKHDLYLNISTCEVFRILSAPLFYRTHVRELFSKETNMGENDTQLKLNFCNEH